MALKSPTFTVDLLNQRPNQRQKSLLGARHLSHRVQQEGREPKSTEQGI